MSYPSHIQQVRAGLQQRKRELMDCRQRRGEDLTRATAPTPPDLVGAVLRLQNEETLRAIDHAAEAELAEINEALHRLDEGTYGLCKHCGGPITPMRLVALPQTVTCARCPTN